ncbi:SMI1/KNR4 family protein [Lentzea terrae]|uniref:SMI1/KNR4 family protein n=1 Tax=Lentzea terrae TaxID=2200761 RepID=UPI000DD37AD7|nr:SMI1/KNR4 family protein [Lentzea terrae]
MNDRVRELAELTGWTGRSYVNTSWGAVHAKLGFALPSDYRDLLDVFPPGTFFAPSGIANVIVWPPYRVDGVEDHLYQFETEVHEAESWRREHPEDVPEGMVPWARSDRPGLFWVPRSPDPEVWTVAISNGGIWRYGDEPVVEEFECGAVEFLIGFVTGRLHSRVLSPRDDVRPGPMAPFRPIDEQKWLEVSDKRSPQVRRISLRDLG